MLDSASATGREGKGEPRHVPYPWDVHLAKLRPCNGRLLTALPKPGKTTPHPAARLPSHQINSTVRSVSPSSPTPVMKSTKLSMLFCPTQPIRRLQMAMD